MAISAGPSNPGASGNTLGSLQAKSSLSGHFEEPKSFRVNSTKSEMSNKRTLTRRILFGPTMKLSRLIILCLSGLGQPCLTSRAERTDWPGTQASPSSQSMAAAAIEAMNGFYNQTDGRWSTAAAGWLSSNALQAVLDFMHKTGSRKYLQQVEQSIEKQQKTTLNQVDSKGVPASLVADAGWRALAFVRLFDLTQRPEYLDSAAKDEQNMYDHWTDRRCGGGIGQDIPSATTYKTAISNELYIKTAVSLHNRRPGNGTYLQRAQRVWIWFRESGMIDESHFVNAGLTEDANGTCTSIEGTVWTYTQGVILGGLVELYRATKSASYLDAARDMADMVLSSTLAPAGGLLTEPCDWDLSCSEEQAAFKGVFARNLDELAAVSNDTRYRQFLWQNANFAWDEDRNASNFFDASWHGPFDGYSIGSQASAVSLLVAALNSSLET